MKVCLLENAVLDCLLFSLFYFFFFFISIIITITAFISLISSQHFSSRKIVNSLVFHETSKTISNVRRLIVVPIFFI